MTGVILSRAKISNFKNFPYISSVAMAGKKILKMNDSKIKFYKEGSIEKYFSVTQTFK